MGQFSRNKKLTVFLGGVEKKKVTVDLLKQRIGGFIELIGVPIWVYAATHGNHYRKPSTEMWDRMTQELKIDPVLIHSVYVGDAAGRVKGWATGKKKDFSCSDRKFAHNVGLPFKTPEMYFQGAEPTDKWEWGGFNGAAFLETYKAPALPKLQPSKGQEMVFMIGPPASGKSTYTERYYPKHVRVNRDTLKTKAKCLKRTREALEAGDSVVIDNTNPKKSDREPYLKLLNQFGDKGIIRTTALVMDTPKDLALHLNELRVKRTKGEVKNIPMVVYHTYYKYYEEPDSSEGIQNVVHIPFTLTFENDEHKALFSERS